MRRRWAAGAGTRGRSIGLSRKGDEQLKRGAGHPSTGPAGPGRRFAAIALIGAALLLAAVLSLGVGYYALTPLQVVQAIGSRLGLYHGEVLPQALTVVFRSRMPRIIASVLIGGALSVSGAAYQGMFKNPLVAPEILGVAAGAGLGASIAIAGGFPYYMTQVFAFVFGLAVVLIAYLISGRTTQLPTVSLVLAGVMLKTLCTSAISMIKYVADPTDALPAITFWLMGSLNKVTWDSLRFSLPMMAAGFLVLHLMRWRINLLTLDDEEAISLGANPRRDRIMVVVAATVLSAAAVCLGGIIEWVGFMIPHIARMLFGSEYKYIVPASTLLGALFLLAADGLARSLLVMELPLSVLTSFVGAPFFIFLILRRTGRG
ncbi:MAG: iron ABC transporter permease [Clostridiales bacterium]|nr:iron ABC transporter permease [Clostridiales bacterium]